MKEPQEISQRLLNANGPYEHGIWTSGDFSLDNLKNKAGTYLFFKRSFNLVETISKRLLENFTYEELSNKTILDVGCYDGWILHQLNVRFNFKRAVGVEPRLKNIQKGEYARRHYGVESKIEVFQGDIDSVGELFPNTSFEIVLCLGTIHHVESTPHAIRCVSKKTSDVLIIDSMVIDKPKSDEKNILHLLNLKDVVYLDSEFEWATAAFKFESPYFDGSAFRNQIVNVPEKRLIVMVLNSLGFTILDSSAPDEEFYNKKYQKLRGVRESFIFAKKKAVTTSDTNNWVEKASIYESIFTFGILELDVLTKWITKLDLNEFAFPPTKDSKKLRVSLRSTLLFLYSKSPTRKITGLLMNKIEISRDNLEILTNISRAPRDKILLEIGKRKIKERDYKLAKTALEQILDGENADWRSFYRATYLLSIIYLISKDTDNYNKAIKILNVSNPEWPLTEKQGMYWVFQEA